ncbi:hypothetical protein [Parafrankia discariae]|uniref:hypothetical protein n=1 Tax=Parafrankia discariae TaxID=365528 RepID=UPI0012B68BB0|nr:hypothetical protein [Parafrankia discariae]
MGSHSAGRHSRAGSTATDRRNRAPVPGPASDQGRPIDDQAPRPDQTPRPDQALTSRARTPYPPGGAPRSGWVASEWSSNPSAATASLPRRPPPRPATRPPGELDTVTGPISMSTSQRRELFGDDPRPGQADAYGRSTRRGARSAGGGRPGGRLDDTADLGVRRPGELDPQRVGDEARAAGGPDASRSSLFEPARPAGSLRLDTAPRSGARAEGTRSTTASRAAASRPVARPTGSTTGRGAHRAPAPRRGPSRTRMVVAGTASLAGLSAIVTGVALSGDQPVTAAGPTTGATPLVQVAGARPAAFGSDDTQASRDGRAPLPTYPTAAPATTGGSGTTDRSDSGYWSSPSGPSAPAYTGSGTQQQGLSGYEIPFVPLTPRSTATPSPAAGGTTTPDSTTSGTTNPGTTAPGATTPGTATPGNTAPGTTTPGSTAPGTTTPTQPGATASPTHGTTSSPAPTTTRPTTSSSSTPAPAPSRAGSLPFNPTPVEVTPIWDLLFPAQGQSTSTSSSAPAGSSATPAPTASSSTGAGS